MKTLLLATNNQHKIDEIREILRELPIRLVTPKELSLDLDIPETGESYLDNALIKARAFHLVSGLPVLADDSGLEVDLLDGQPGIHSHRFLPDPKATSHDRCLYLLSRLSGFPQPWLAHFNCEAVLYLSEESWFSSNGQIYGEIIEQFRGTNGFGYDPIFFITEQNKTMAELDSRSKNQISHRGLALKNFTALRDWAAKST